MDELTLLARLIGVHYPDPAARKQLLHNLHRANPDEITILANLMKIKDAQRSFREVLSGAHVTIFDLGQRYKAWQALTSADSRPSSHKSDGTQYHVDGPFCHTILFGKRGSLTWLQLEDHPLGGVKNFAAHIGDWVKYSVTHKNRGPYGSSSHTDNNPLYYLPLDPKVVSPHRSLMRMR